MTTQSTSEALALGEQAPDFTLPATDGQTYSLSSFEGTPILAVIFSANHCPYVGAWEDRMIALGREFGARDVGFALISSNDAERFPQDSFEQMRKRAEEKGYPFPYLYDETQSAAHAYGPTRTPEVFVFDRGRILRYHGAVDSDWEEGPEVQPYLRDALEQLLAGQEVALPETKPVGCSLKLKS
jgi:peroxiredoxin